MDHHGDSPENALEKVEGTIHDLLELGLSWETFVELGNHIFGGNPDLLMKNSRAHLQALDKASGASRLLNNDKIAAGLQDKAKQDCLDLCIKAKVKVVEPEVDIKGNVLGKTTISLCSDISKLTLR
jgi:hypothetical protein